MADETNQGAATRVPSPIRNEIATVERDITRPFFGPLLLNRDDTLATRGGSAGLKIYDDIERDTRVFSCMQKRKMALVAYPWQLDAASDAPADQDVRDLVERALNSFGFSQLVVGLLDAILKGFAVAEIMWGIVDNEVRPIDAKIRDQRRFRFDVDYQLRLLDFEDILLGKVVPDRKFVLHSVGAKDGSPYGLGLGTRLFWPAWFKRQNTAFWLSFNDKYGSPTSVGKYPAGTPEPDQARLLAALQAIARDAGVIVPEGMSIELLQAAQSGAVDAFDRFLARQDDAIAETILGETLTTSVDGGGSYAAANTHNDVRLELTQADGELLAGTLNKSLVPWIVQLNRPGAQPPKLKFLVDQEENLAERVDRDVKVSGMGFRPTLDYIQRTYGGEWTEAPAPTVPSPGDSLFAEPHRHGPGSAEIDALAARPTPQIEDWTSRVRDLAGKATSLEDLRDRLIDLYPTISPAAFTEVMGKAMVLAHAAGMGDVPGAGSHDQDEGAEEHDD